MKEIKFRAFQKSTQKMLPVNSLKAICTNSERLTEEEYDDLIIMQSTGLFDKNGKEIFEGDIVNTYDDNGDIENNGVPGLIIFKDCCFHIFDDYERLRDASAGHGSIMIIGNIYENRELLNS